jgi:hypothetical protein
VGSIARSVLGIDKVRRLLGIVLPITKTALLPLRNGADEAKFQDNGLFKTIDSWRLLVYLSRSKYAIETYDPTKEKESRWLLSDVLRLLLLLEPALAQAQIVLDYDECACPGCQSKKTLVRSIFEATGLSRDMLEQVVASVGSVAGTWTSSDTAVGHVLENHRLACEVSDERNEHWVAPPIAKPSEYHLIYGWQNDSGGGYQQSTHWWPEAMCFWKPDFSHSGWLWRLHTKRPPRKLMCESCLRAAIVNYRVCGPPQDP